MREHYLYDALVVTDKVDPELRGGVQARIIGETDEIDDDAQYFVRPDMTCLNAVPEKGYYLKVYFIDGDIAQGRYVAVSPSKDGFLDYNYTAKNSYPNVAVYNLGGDGFMRYYDRAKQMSTIDCPNGGHIVWDGESKILMTSDKAYINAGTGANNNEGVPEHAVLTEASIDIFTAMPVGKGVLNQGSEYLTIPHVSAKTIEAYNNPTADNKTTEPSVIVESDPSATFLPINDANGKKVGEVELSLTRNYISRYDKKIDKIIIGISDSKTFPEMADEFMKDGSQSSAHYLVGQIEGDPEIASEKPNALLNNSGFLQFVQLDQDAYYASGVEYNDEAANKNAVSIVLVASENPLSAIGSYSTYQKSMVKKLIAHIRAEAKDDTIPVINASDLDGQPSLPKMTVTFE